MEQWFRGSVIELFKNFKKKINTYPITDII